MALPIELPIARQSRAMAMRLRCLAFDKALKAHTSPEVPQTC